MEFDFSFFTNKQNFKQNLFKLSKVFTLCQQKLVSLTNKSACQFICTHLYFDSENKRKKYNKYRKSYERECILWFMGTSDVLKVLKIARALGECNLRTFKTSRVTINHKMHEQVHTIFYLLYSRFFYNLVFKFGASPVFPWQLLRIALYNLYCTL